MRNAKIYVLLVVAWQTTSLAAKDVKEGLWQVETRLGVKASTLTKRCFNQEILNLETAPKATVKPGCEQRSSTLNNNFRLNLSCKDGTVATSTVKIVTDTHIEVIQSITLKTKEFAQQTSSSESTQRWLKTDCGNLKPGEYEDETAADRRK